MTERRQASIFQVGDVLNNTYRIEAVLGRGGTSEVYRAKSEISGHEVALKALRSEFSNNADFVTLMTREEAIREVRHDAIVRYYHNQRTADGVVFLVMDYVRGVGLDAKMKAGGMSAEDLMTVAQRVAEGLAVAHAANITHRDLSPDNIILRNGDPADPVIIDFGIAKDSNPGAQTIVGNEFAGKYAYAAPEQLEGKADQRADIYALGVSLLATFRGKTPDVGANPLEVIAAKAQRPDTSGVPEPLRTVIEQMTAPDRERRLQNTDELLDLLRGDIVVSAEFDTEATKIVPLPGGGQTPRQAATGIPQPKSQTGSETDTAPLTTGGRRTPLIAAGAVALAIAGGAGAYFGGLIPPALPEVDPFTLTVARTAEGGMSAEGFVPSEDMATTLADRMTLLGGTSTLSVARGAIGEDWGTSVMALIEMATPLDTLDLSVFNSDVTLAGVTNDRALYDTLTARLDDPATAPGLTVATALELGPRLLAPSDVDAAMQPLADCGPLTLLSPPLAYDQDARVIILGRVAQPETRQAVAQAVSAIAGFRPVDVETEVLNPALCAVDAVLPQAPSGGLSVGFRDGATDTENATGRFFVGDNPVIDVTIPADVETGFLLVSVIDVTGNVFHLLPNRNRPDNRIAALRAGQSGPVTVRVAYTLDEARAANGAKLAFEVDDTALGKSRVLAITADVDVFGGLRPTTESTESFTDMLAANDAVIRSLDSRLLTTEAR